MNPRTLRRIVSLIAFAGAVAAYLPTLEPDASFWDCPEYLVGAIKMEPGHPPGNPTWMLTARIFSLLGGSSAQGMAVAVNASSAIFTALAVGILASVIFILLHLLFHPSKKGLAKWSIAAASLGGALCFGFSDSPWFSAVEAEVYAMSLFLTALTIRLMEGWVFIRSPRLAARHLLLIAYLLALSLGVHQLNLLVIPALSLIWLYKRYPKPGIWRICGVLAFSMAIVGGVLALLMPGLIQLIGLTELWSVNKLGMPYGSGFWIFWAVALCAAFLIPIAFNASYRISGKWQVWLWMPLMFLAGYSSYMIIPIRGAANPSINTGYPSDPFALKAYLERDQYGSAPLLYGRTPYSTQMRLERFGADGTPDYSRYARRTIGARYARSMAGARGKVLPASGKSSINRKGYLVNDSIRKPIYTPELDMWLPRLHSGDPADIATYADWAGMDSSTMVKVECSFALDSLGNPVGRMDADGFRHKDMRLRPTYLQSLRMLLGYQIGYMYFRYLLWNYSGRQNDRFATGEIEHGNFITGFPLLDNLMLGDQEMLPEEVGPSNRGHNRYFLLPLIAGLIGICVLLTSRRKRQADFTIFILFLLTGIAITVYLNQTPREPRERDYSFLGSFWAYAIWIGIGFYFLIASSLKIRMNHRFGRILRNIAIPASFLFALGLPLWMLAENYDDHDRSGRQGVTQYAANMLESLEPDAILFVNGDNYTFPLWWAQEVAGIRPDVTIVNMAYLGTNWYPRQLMTPTSGHPGFNFQASEADIYYGNLSWIPYIKAEFPSNREDTLCAEDALESLSRVYADSTFKTPLAQWLKIKIPGAQSDSIVVSASAVASAGVQMSQRNLLILDLIASNAASPKPRPIYWQQSLGVSNFGGFYPYAQRALLTRKLVYTQNPGAYEIKTLLANDYQVAMTMLSGAKEGYDIEEIYADDTFGSMIHPQRTALIRLSKRLFRGGMIEESLHTAIKAEKTFPRSTWEYRTFHDGDSLCNEANELGNLYLELANHKKGEEADSLQRRGHALIKMEEERKQQWRNFRQSLPPAKRNLLTPRHRRDAQFAN